MRPSAVEPHHLFWLKIGIEIEGEAESSADDPMKTATFGGTFDPIHRARTQKAREAAETFSLDRILFIPAANPPLKEASASYEDRFRMVQLACEGEPWPGCFAS